MSTPVVQNQSPTPNATDALRWGPYSFEVVDLTDGINAASVKIWVNDDLVWTNDAATGNWTVTKTTISGGYRYEFTPDAPFNKKQRLTFRVYAQDTLGSAVDTSYGATTEFLLYLMRDLFDTNKLKSIAGNGSYSLSGGEMTYSVPGVNTDWYTTFRNGVVPYHSVPNTNLSRYSKIYIETEMTNWSGSDGYNNHSMWGFEQNYQNFLMIYTDDAASAAPNFYGYRCRNASWVGLAAFTGNPVTLPAKMRMVWTPSAGTFEYQIWSGGAWVTWITEVQSDFVPDKVFWYLKSWGGRTVSMKHSYGYVYVDEQNDQPIDDAIQSAWEDSYRLRTVGGGTKHSVPVIGMGQVLPGAVTQPPGNASGAGPAREEGGWEDGFRLRGAGGPTLRHTTPRLSRALDINFDSANIEATAGFEDSNFFYLLSNLADFNKTTYDAQGHPHFTSENYWEAYYYDARNDAWAYPTLNNFTGYAKNGKKYTNGVEDSGPVWAPWASEAASNNRSNRASFPNKALIVVGIREVVIFDCDSYTGAVSSLVVWMRFLVDTTNFWALGRYDNKVRQVKMVNGVLIVATQFLSSENGGIHCIDFKATGQNWALLLRADGRWWGNTGTSIATRNTVVYTQQTTAAQVESEYMYRVDAWPTGTNGLYIVCSGDDPEDPQVLYTVNNQIQWSERNWGDDRGSESQDFWNKSVHIDAKGWLWIARGTKLWRIGTYYQDRLLDTNEADPRMPRVTLPYAIYWLTSGRDYIYAGTAQGIFAIRRSTLEYWCLYTTSGYRGGGRLDAPPAGEVLAGRWQRIYKCTCLSFAGSSYLAVSIGWENKGGVTLMRLYDDEIIQAYAYPTIVEDGAKFNVLVPST